MSGASRGLPSILLSQQHSTGPAWMPKPANFLKAEEYFIAAPRSKANTTGRRYACMVASEFGERPACWIC
jgi:hypothetical protein